ncbi:fungal-specific transcription factor domain-containing protein [Pseudomassariella vexata]|uniref:Fungal-specific transcription factor domain-domain-containing protein n=1 Tax=Pseudomassariella vexata TaxID=1141098 RepID=A0A1Y2DLN4_9PEZI|nr:fungal-specific transcription factor domain-containing protein [Pseudomassariella vexata]ORY60049.1 fungal-specific transcription factor domain-domain-containing protein [Pseudomassariella vexata]
MAAIVSGGAGAPPLKTIRFVNNQGQPPQKRRRINAACLTCRKRKTRCAGEHPTCSTCAKNGHDCLGYSDAAEKKRDSISGAGHGGVAIDLDDEDFLEEEPEDDRTHGKANRNGSRPCGMVASTAASSRRISESGHQRANVLSAARPKTDNVEWDDHGKLKVVRRPTNPRNASISTDDGRSPSTRSPVQHHTESHRVPFFRYFGPTAIVPGFKQMVVKVHDRRRSSMSATSPGSGGPPYVGLMSSVASDHDLVPLEDMPVYDPNDSSPVPDLIMHLVDTFFVHLGCNYPFLRPNKFPMLVREKRVEPILVDAVCALAARFSDHPIFTRQDGKLSSADFGHVFAQRAKAATVDTFPCPSVAAVQACLLMAYEGFGADQDSALWMYLGLAIRMAIDLGLHKKDGVKYQGDKDPWFTRQYHRKPSDSNPNEVKPDEDEDAPSPQEQTELEQERIDTLWSVFILDRVISSGTGRSVTMRDDDFELPFPKASDDSPKWPDPFPNLIQIIHVYGRVSDVLNNIRSAKDLTQDRINRLVQMEQELTKLHQKLHPRLRFDANNFQEYVRRGQGTTFILLHFWFHALITVLHQPTLLAPLEKINRMHELVPHSRELSMSSAKTIVDILAFARLLDPKSFIGNPFTSQPIYIAACAFLAQSVANSSQPVSRDSTPPPETKPAGMEKPYGARGDSKSASRHFLLASAATQNYQSCYKALQQMHTHWGGVRYILTALDQKSEGIWDCETYTREEYESIRQPRRHGSVSRFTMPETYPASPTVPPLAWSLTGTTNSPNSSLTLLYQAPAGNGTTCIIPKPPTQPPPPPASAPTPPGNMIYDPIRQSLPETTQMFPPAYPQPNTSALRHSVNPPQRTRRVSSVSNHSRSLLRYDGLPPENARKTPSTPDPKLQMAFASQAGSVAIPTSYTPSSQHSSGYEPSTYPTGASPASAVTDAHPPSTHSHQHSHSGSIDHSTSSGYSYLGPSGQGISFQVIESEGDIGQHLASFEPTDMMGWFGEYFPNDVLGLYDMAGSSL